GSQSFQPRWRGRPRRGRQRRWRLEGNALPWRPEAAMGSVRGGDPGSSQEVPRLARHLRHRRGGRARLRRRRSQVPRPQGQDQLPLPRRPRRRRRSSPSRIRFHSGGSRQPQQQHRGVVCPVEAAGRQTPTSGSRPRATVRPVPLPARRCGGGSMPASAGALDPIAASTKAAAAAKAVRPAMMKVFRVSAGSRVTQTRRRWLIVLARHRPRRREVRFDLDLNMPPPPEVA
ncbi:unnamed protein product, partial [Musa acuminata var. zebrina]